MFNLQAHTAMTEGQQSPVKEAHTSHLLCLLSTMQLMSPHHEPKIEHSEPARRMLWTVSKYEADAEVLRG